MNSNTTKDSSAENASREQSQQAQVVRSPQELLSKVEELQKEHKWLWFRGQPQENLDLVPSVCRPPKFGTRNERSLAQVFRLQAVSRYPNCPHVEDYPNWLFLMQHYGLPTRLLDWSASPLVGAFFAVQDRRSDPRGDDPWPAAEIYVLDPMLLNFYELPDSPSRKLLRKLLDDHPECEIWDLIEDDWLDPWDKSNEEIFEAPFKGRHFHGGEDDQLLDGPILAIKPTEFDMRVTVQASRFTIHCRPEPLQTHQITGKMLHRFKIPGSERKDFLLKLQKMKFHRATLFPDLDNLTEDLSRFGASIEV